MTGTGPTQPTEEYFNRGQWGHDGTRWRKLPVLWGYTDRYAEAEVNLSAATGGNVLIFSTVPTGEVWRVTGLTWVNINTACSAISAILNDGSNQYSVSVEPVPAANVYKSILVDVTLKAGDNLQIGFYGCVLNDDLYAWAFGYKMAVA